MHNYWKSVRVLVTGAGGFSGSNAVDYFTEIGAIVTAVYHKKKKTKHNARITYADLLNINDANKVCRNQDIIFNFAAIDGSADFKRNHPQEILSDNLTINLNMLRAATKSHVKQFVLISSSEVNNLNANKNPGAYASSKFISEQIALEFAKHFGIDLLIVRPSNIFGPYDNYMNNNNIRFIPLTIKNILLGDKIVLRGDGKQMVSYLYIKDYLKILSKLVEKKAFGFPITVASEKYISLRSIVKKISTILAIRPNLEVDSKTNYQKASKPRINDLKKYLGKYTEINFNQALTKTIFYYKSTRNESK